MTGFTVQIFFSFLYLKITTVLANIVDPLGTRHDAAFHFGSSLFFKVHILKSLVC